MTFETHMKSSIIGGTLILVTFSVIRAQDSATTTIDTVEIDPSLPSFIIKCVSGSDSARLKISALDSTVPFQVIDGHSEENGVDDYSLYDINFDGYLDLRFDRLNDRAVKESDFWIYNPTDRKFERDPEFSFDNVFIDSASKRITSTNWNDEEETYWVVDHRLKLVEHEYNGRDLSYKQIMRDDSLTTIWSDTVEKRTDNSGESYLYKVSSEYDFGHLRVMKRTKARPSGGDPAEDQCFWKETFGYHKNQRDQIVVDSTIEVFVKNRWVVETQGARIIK